MIILATAWLSGNKYVSLGIAIALLWLFVPLYFSFLFDDGEPCQGHPCGPAFAYALGVAIYSFWGPVGVLSGVRAVWLNKSRNYSDVFRFVGLIVIALLLVVSIVSWWDWYLLLQ